MTHASTLERKTLDLSKSAGNPRNLSLVNGTIDGPENLFYPSSTKQIAGPLSKNLNNIHIATEQRKPGTQPRTGVANSTRSTKLSGQKLRKLPDGARTVEVENMPSDISDDEWGEIQKFGQRLHEEQLKKHKEQMEQKRKQVKNVLD